MALGNWKGSIPIPDQTLESREEQLAGHDRTLFLTFMRKALRWVPEDRPTAAELAPDEYLMQAVLKAKQAAEEPESR